MEKRKCMGSVGQLKTFDKSDTLEFFNVHDIQTFEFNIKSLSEKITRSPNYPTSNTPRFRSGGVSSTAI